MNFQIKSWMDPFFYVFFNFGQFNGTYFVFCLFSINCFIILYEIFYKCNFQLWDPLLTTLTRVNWSQFVENNLNFKPTFSLIEGLLNPTRWMRRWKVVLKKLQDYRQVRFYSLYIFTKLSIKLFSKFDNYLNNWNSLIILF